MKRRNATRNALVTSIISMLLCVSMLVGTTFAWFTDTAASGLNQIIAGNLDVELLYKDGDAYKNAADVKLFDDIELWEPGMVVYETVKIANVGNLALKYALSINTGNENTLNGHSLSEILHFAVIDGEIAKTLSRTEVLAIAEGSADKGMLTSYTFNNQFSLEAKTESEPMTLIVYWPENGELDNLYNVNNGQITSDGAALHIDLGLKVFASQETVEKDSFDEYYDDTASYPENMWLGDVAEALVIDEENKTISISTGAELAKLAEVVNAGTDYAGYTVELTDSIDLNNIAWTPIGTEDHMLKAEVNGNGHTIYNLKVSGENCVGLFGCTYTDGTNGTSITDVHVVNATVAGNHWVGAIVGKLNYGNLTDCSVTNAKIVVIPNGDEGAYDNGDKVGGIAGFMTEGEWEISGNKATNVYLKAYRDVGGIVGIAHQRNIVKNNVVENIKIVVDQATNAYGDKDFNAGGIAGRVYDSTTVEDNNFETDVVISYVVATETALRNAMAKGGSVTLGADVAVDADTTINVVGTTVLDLNGYTLSGVSDQTGKNSSIIVAGKNTELTVKNGTVTMQHTGDNMEWDNSTNALEAVSGGKLTLDHVHVKNLGGSDMAYAVNIGNNGGATLKTVASTLESENYTALRIFNNADGKINVDLTEGTRLTSASGPFFVHFWSEADLGAKQADRQAYLSVNFNDTVVSRYSGSKSLIRFGFTDAIYYSDTAMTEVVAGTEKALNWAIANGKNVLLNNDLALSATVAIPADTTTVLDLNGKTLSYKSTTAAASCAINNKGDLTIKNGTITYEGVGDPSFGYGTNTINNTGKLVIDGATIINTTTAGSSVAIDCSAGAELIVNSGEIKSEKNAIRLCPFGSAAINCTINGGTITGARAIQIQLPSNNPAEAPEINLTVNGGTLNGTGESGLSIYSYSAGQSFANVKVTLTGGTFNYDVAFGGGNAKTTQETVTVTGGIFNGYLGRYVVDDGTNDGWVDIAKP